MKSRFLLLLAAAFLLYVPVPAKAAPGSAVLTSVSGKVTVRRKGKTVVLHRDAKVHEGETLATSQDSNATLRFFDGSEVQVKPGTKFTLVKVEKDGPEDKVLKFKLLLGRLFASVQKLSSSRSSFEIEAGGVVCGVRGTQYEVGYDGQEKVDLFVKEGNVWAKAGGSIFQYGAGSESHFRGGHLDIPRNPGNGRDHDKKGKGHEPPGPPQGRRDQPPGPPNRFDPFMGMGGNRPDPFKPLTGGTSDTGTIGNKAGDANLQGLGAHTVILLLKYPEQ
ncbi:MAG TPA: FecR family protein [bacterium]|nr:FecR family protein [bacterium]